MPDIAPLLLLLGSLMSCWGWVVTSIATACITAGCCWIGVLRILTGFIFGYVLVYFLVCTCSKCRVWKVYTPSVLRTGLS
jgi:uncharacterized membrane protein (DUF485 family)